MASIPDLDKIVKLSEIFGVSTDYLLKEDAEPQDAASAPEAGTSDFKPAARPVTLDEANNYLSQMLHSSMHIAIGVVLCILCPVPVILLGVLSEQPQSAVTEAMASGIGIGCLFLMIAVAVVLFIREGLQLNRYEYLSKEPIAAEYGVAGIAERKKEDFSPIWRRNLISGVTCCILAVVPVILTGAFFSENDILMSWAIALLFALIACGVFLMVRGGMILDSFSVLLEEGDHARDKKLQAKKNDPIAAIYWCSVTAAYLAWSFLTFEWHRTWIIWPVAAVLYGAISAIAGCIRSSRK